jgi:hypothetical protein
MNAWTKLAAALVPLFLAALVSIAWTNSHALVRLGANMETLRDDIERIERNAAGCTPEQRK